MSHMRLHIEYPDKPIALQRARASKGFFYDPQCQVKENIRKYVLPQIPTALQPFTGAIVLKPIFYMPIPKSWSKKKANAFLGQPHTIRPDFDNLLKMVMDTFQGMLWIDDCLIWKLIEPQKIWAIEGKTVFEIYTD